MKVLIQLTKEQEERAIPILLRYSPGAVLAHGTYLVEEHAAEALREAGVEFTDLGREADWSDDEVLAATNQTFRAEQDRRLSELLYRQQAGLLRGCFKKGTGPLKITGPVPFLKQSLSPSEKPELTALMAAYQFGLLSKARALAEAVRRGLRPPLQS